LQQFLLQRFSTATNFLLQKASVAQPSSVGAWLVQTTRMLTGGRSYWPVLGTFWLFYVFGLPPLYLTLLASRKKQLAPPAKGDAKKKTR